MSASFLAAASARAALLGPFGRGGLYFVGGLRYFFFVVLDVFVVSFSSLSWVSCSSVFVFFLFVLFCFILFLLLFLVSCLLSSSSSSS